MEYNEYKKARVHARYNRKPLQNDKLCGCYFCLRIFSPDKIVEWCLEPDNEEDGVTAICPFCEIDSIIGEGAGYPLTSDFLKSMNYYAFVEE